MSDTETQSGSGLIEVKFTDKEERVLKVAWACMKSFPEIDLPKLTDAAGFNTQKTCSNTWGTLKKKLIAQAAANGVACDIPVKQTPTKQTPAKQTPAKQTSAKGTKAIKATPKKRTKTEVSDEDAISGDETPTKKARNSRIVVAVKAEDDDFNADTSTAEYDVFDNITVAPEVHASSDENHATTAAEGHAETSHKSTRGRAKKTVEPKQEAETENADVLPAEPSTPKTKRGRKPAAPKTPSSKMDSGDDDSGLTLSEQSTPEPKAKKTRKSAAKKSPSLKVETVGDLDMAEAEPSTPPATKKGRKSTIKKTPILTPKLEDDSDDAEEMDGADPITPTIVKKERKSVVKNSPAPKLEVDDEDAAIVGDV